MTDVVVVGELCADIVVALAGPVEFGQTETLVRSTEVVMGSSSAITACGLARLGVSTELVSVVGEDLLGGFLLGELRGRDVGVDGVRVDPEVPTGSSTILTRPDGDRSILTHLGSIGQTTVVDVAPELTRAARHVHVGSYFLQYAMHDSLGGLFRGLRAAGLTTSLDPNYDPEQTWTSGITDVLPEVDVLFGNQAELTAIAGSTALDEAVSSLLARLPEGAALVVKRGADGAELHRRDHPPYRCEVPADDRAFVDTVGAGDSLAAGYLAATLRGLEPEHALRIGVACGTASTRGTGGIAAQATWEQVANSV